LFIFAIDDFDGLLPIGHDEYDLSGALIETSRIKNVRRQDIRPSEFDVKQAQ